MDQFDRLLIVTLTPLCLLILLLVLYLGTDGLVARLKHSLDAAAQAALSTKYRVWAVKAAIAVVFVIYPSVSTEIVKSFRCMDFEGGVSVLRADFRISCHSAPYRRMLAFSWAMFAVFPVGVPAALFFVLYRRRHELYPRNLGVKVCVKHSESRLVPDQIDVTASCGC